MKLNLTKLLIILFSISLQMQLSAQKSKTSAAVKINYPATFTISKTDFDHLFTKKPKEVISAEGNKYLAQSQVLMNTLNGDMKFMKIKLNYFKNAYLMIQVNGEYSTQIFILSDDKSVFYKGNIDRGTLTMTKCNEDDIVSE